MLDVESPRSAWSKYFSEHVAVSKKIEFLLFFLAYTTPILQDVPLKPIKLSSETLSEVGLNPQKKAVVVSLPTIESTFSMHTSKTIKGFKHPEFPALRLAIEVMSATESYLWVRP